MKTFEQLGLIPELLQAITELGFEHPMPVQEEVIPYLLGEENDIIALAQTGTGKTAAFGLPVLQKINQELRQPQALVLCPTRELCLQIADDLNDYSKYLPRLKVLPVYGGSSIESQIKTLKKGVHVVVATPGRLLDLMNRRCVDLSAIVNVILDEADEMLNMGFSESIDAILAEVPTTRNTLLFSATMPDEIARISKKYMSRPREIVIGNRNESTANVKHLYYMVQAKDKYLTLKRIADYYPNIYGIVFCRTRKDTQEIADKLIQDGYNADALHGDLSQAQRDYVMQKFRVRNIQLLVATDVAARGLDVNDLSHIINYSLPDESEAYTHRSGRTGRAGKTGISISIINLKEKHKIREIEKKINKTFTAATMPSGKDICAKQVFNLMDRIEKVKVSEKEIADLLPQVYRKLEWLEKEDLIKRIVSLEFNRLIDYYQEAEDIQTIDETAAGKRERAKNPHASRDVSGAEPGFTRIFIGLGRMDGINPKNILGLVNDYVDRKIQVGRIDFFTRYSLFDVEDKSAREVVHALRNLDFLGRNVRVDLATPEQMSRASKERKAYAPENKFTRNRKPSYNRGSEERDFPGGYYRDSNSGGGRKPFKSRNVGSRKK
ncbi:MAG: DEAD/DEAH box helicase [Bacteroidales bacterium]|nr:DEAD/DEAH box helicase [Bacteroidales bacterium]MDD4361461.1 DEAD/DEAH box helicase [Bacteroidales bacterium]